MARRARTAAQLSKDAGLDLDETLVALWDAGFDDIADPNDSISASGIKAAQQALGLPTSSDLRRPDYWQERLQMTTEEFETALAGAGIELSGQARRLPKGAVSKLRKIEREKFGGVLTGTEVSQPSDRKLQRGLSDPVNWKTIGHEDRTIVYLTVEQVLHIHELLVREFASSNDPIDPPGVKNQNLLESAVMRPRTSIGDELKYPTPEMAAAALLHSIVNNHAFHNGNKRTGLVAMAVALYENGIQLGCGHDDLFKLVLQTAQHRLVPQGSTELPDREVLHLSQWISSHSRLLDKGEHVIKWHQLKKILASFDVKWERPGGTGNRINLSRAVERHRGVLRKKPTRQTLRTQVYYQSDGGDVEKNSIAKIRKDLELDEINGVDSVVFYGKENVPEGVIVEYQRLLARLAKL